LGATIEPMMEGRTQVILVATGLDNEAPAVMKPEYKYKRPAAVVPVPVDAVQEEPEGLLEPQSADLADALFNQAVTGKSTEQPWVAADAHASRSSLPQAQNSLDVPAFLRRRRSLRDLEGEK
jgi:hypothetical protein